MDKWSKSARHGVKILQDMSVNQHPQIMRLTLYSKDIILNTDIINIDRHTDNRKYCRYWQKRAIKR